MKVNKFGGASVKNAEGIKNISHIIKDFNEHTIVVVSAIGKTTNLLESITRAFYNEDDAKSFSFIEDFKSMFFLYDDF